MAMDEAVRLKYRELVRTGFEYAGEIENPDIFIDTMVEGIRLCSANTQGFMNIYLTVTNDRVEDIRYKCSCDPTANVVVETMCRIMKGKTLDEVTATTPEDYFNAIGSRGKVLVERVDGIIELLNRSVERYRKENSSV